MHHTKYSIHQLSRLAYSPTSRALRNPSLLPFHKHSLISTTVSTFTSSSTLSSSTTVPAHNTSTTPTPESSTTVTVPSAITAPQLLLNPNFHPKIIQKSEKAYNRSTSLLIGAVAYCEAISSIWKGIARHFYRQGLDVDFVLFTSYERLQDALLQKQIHIAWNGPLAHARLIQYLESQPKSTVPLSLGMRDVDRDFRSHIIVRHDANIQSLQDLANRRIATGTVDSPQGYIMPLEYLVRNNIPLNSLSVFRFDRDIGKHGDTAYGEDSTLEALVNGTVEAGFISDLMWQRYIAANKVPIIPNTNTPLLQILSLPQPILFDHCQFDALPSIGFKRAEAFQKALLAMDGSGHAEDKRTLELEGIKNTWLLPRETNNPKKGYENMLNALTIFNGSKKRYPGVLHTHKNHPFKHLLIDNRVVLDSFGC